MKPDDKSKLCDPRLIRVYVANNLGVCTHGAGPRLCHFERRSS